VDTLGKSLQGRCPPVGPRASLRATPRPRLLHHASGRQLEHAARIRVHLPTSCPERNVFAQLVARFVSPAPS
jgi:hypothetical protein